MAEKKANLPALRRELSRIRESFVPEIFKAPTDIVIYEKNREQYELDHGTGDGFDKIFTNYQHLNRPQAKPKKTKKSQSRALVKVLNRSVLAEYRKEKGLDELREKLIDALIDYASFEKGADAVFEHITSPNNTSRIEIKKSTKAFEMMEKAEKTIDGKLSIIALHYPDMTADEIAWISLTHNKKVEWIFDQDTFLYWPPSIIEMDLDGLVFAHGTIDDVSKGKIETDDPYEIGGFTGVEDKTDLFMFIPNVAAALKALVLLGLDDHDLYDKIWKEEDITAIRRGDDLLLRSFINPGDLGIQGDDLENTLNDLVNDSKNSLDWDYISNIREQIAGLYSSSYFNCPHINSLIDFVKLVGTLERIPEFITQKKPFRGYVKLYGTDINFISENGKIVDAVPLAAHLQSRVAHQFHQRVYQLNRKDNILRRIYNELCGRISVKNIEQGKQMPIDMQHEQILSRGIFVSPQSYASVEKMNEDNFFIKKYSDDERIICTTKFSFNEMDDIIDMINAMPAQFITGIKRITKKTSPYVDVESMLYGQEKAGQYSPETGAITLSLPVASPFSKDEMHLGLRIHFAKTKKEKQHAEKELAQLTLFETFFNFTLAHEVAESIYANNPMVQKAWQGLTSKIPEGLSRDERTRYFLTDYSCKADNEDFADTFAVYWAYGRSFRALAGKHAMLDEKYQFMKKLWSADGSEREFNDRFPGGIYVVNEPANFDWEKKMQLGYLRDSYIVETLGYQEARIMAGTVAYSYEDVEEIIAEAEANGETITREDAVRRFGESRKASALEEIEEVRHRDWVYAEIHSRTYSALMSPQFDIAEFEKIYCDFARAMIEGDKKTAAAYLHESHVPKRTANKVVKKLMPFYRGASEIIEERIKKGEIILEDGEFTDGVIELVRHQLKKTVDNKFR